MTRSRRRTPVILSLLAAALAYAAWDLFWPLHRDLRHFDPVAVGTLEAKMWHSYYEREPARLFAQLAQTLRTAYGFPLLRSYLGAYRGATAAFVFKDGKQRSDYEKALPALTTYFATLHNTGDIDFDIERVAALELEWWIVHRERAKYPDGALGRACAEAAAAFYRVAADRTLASGQLRAQAMLMRDERAERGSLTPADWATIESLLHQSYASLRLAVS